MKIILLEDIKNLGKKGEIKEVGDGYALNFLIPKQKATSVTDAKGKNAILEKESNEKNLDKKNKEEMNIFEAIPKELTIEVKSNEKGILFEKITPKFLVDEFSKTGIVTKEAFFNVDTIKEIGEHEIELDHNGVKQSLKLIIK